MTERPAAAIANALLEALASVSDEIVALSLSKDWPVVEAIKLVAAACPIRVLVRRPFLKQEFESVVELASDAGEATKWRNNPERNFGLIILGVADGKLDAGLNDVQDVDRKTVVRHWRNAIEEEFKRHEELAKPALGPLVERIFDDLAAGTLNPKQVDRYCELLFAEPTLENAYSSLWIIGFLPDANVFDTNETRRKLARNRDLMDAIDRSDDQGVERRLREVAKSGSQYANVASELLSYRDDGDRERLSKITRAEVEAIFSSSSTPSGRKTFDLTGLLNELSNDRDALATVLQHLYAQWDLALPTRLLETTFSSGPETNAVKVVLRPVTAENDESVALETRWSGNDAESPVMSAMSGRSDPGGIDSAEQFYTAESCRSDFEEVGEPTLLAAIDAYLDAREALREFEPWLEYDAFTLMTLNASARTAAELFCNCWADLAKAAVDVPLENPGRHNAINVVQSLETIQGFDGGEIKWITLGCFHPFRLDPVRRVAEHVTSLTSSEEIAQLGDAALWCLDRSYPAYPAIYFDEYAFYRASHKDLIAYVREHASSTPNLRDIAGLDGVFKAIEKYSAWLDDGSNLLVIDPPGGGGVAKALTAARARRANPDDIQVYHLATSEDSDSLDEFNGPLVHLPRAKSLSDVDYLPSANIVLRFVAETTAGSESATTSWAATKGSHLALMMYEEKEGGPFGSASPRIKLDPRASNRIVKSAQSMLAALKGGQPSLATIRPLMQTDDATALSRIGNHADWVIFAAPGPLGLISPEQINSSLKFVGRATTGIYGLYIYGADNLFPVRRHFETFFRDTPVAHLPAEVVTDRLMSRAHDAGQAVLYAAARGVASQVATLVAIRFATKDFADENQTFVLSLDDFGWTRAWLGSGQRADFLVVNFAADGSVRFRVVESKSKTGGKELSISATEEPYQTAIAQVESSLASLRNITEADNPSLEEDLRYASLIEHLMAAILGRSAKLSAQARKKVFEIATALSCREIKPSFDGMVVVTQTGVNSTAKQVDHGELKLIWAGSPDTAQVFGGQVPPSKGVSEDAPVADKGDEGLPNVQPDIAEPAEKEVLDPAVETHGGDDMLVDVDQQDQDIARKFIQAGRVHGIPLIGDQPVYMRTGPTLFTFGIEMQEGAAIRPLENRLPDIARDVGIGEESDQITVANDTRPRTVRISLPRKARVYPTLPSESELKLVETSGYLPIFLGQTIEGADFASSVQSWPHLLVAGTTGSGKTTFMKTLLSQFNGYGSDRLKVVVVDGKGDTDYLGVLSDDMFPAEFPDVQLTHTSAVDVLKWAEEQMEERRKILVDAAKSSPSAAGVKAPALYEDALAQGAVPPITPLILVIDEFAEIMLASKKSADEFEKLVQRITQVGRSRLLHLILATQRPDKETVRGAIKANLDARAVFRLPTQADSMTVLGQSGAEKLLKHGDMLFQHGSGLPIRLQGYKI